MAKSSARGFAAVGYHGKYKAFDPWCHSKTVQLVSHPASHIAGVSAVPAVADNAPVEACI